MIAVGIRELKSRLSAYIRMVRAGETVLVTNRGEVVAELRKPGADAEPTPLPGLNRLIREDVVQMARADAPPGIYTIEDRPALPPGTALRLLDESRGER